MALYGWPTPGTLGEDYLRRRWEQFNRRYFAGSLRTPRIRLGQADRRYSGQFRRVPRQPSEIHINGLLLSFSDPQARLDNTLLHEMVHQYVEEVAGGDEWAHGLIFFSTANRIGVDLRVPFCSLERLCDWPDHVEAMLVGLNADRPPTGGTAWAQTAGRMPRVLVKALPALAPGLLRYLAGTEHWRLRGS